MAILDGLSDIPSKVSELGKTLAPITGFAGFMVGVDSKYLSGNAGTGYPFNGRGLGDMVAQIFGPGVANSIPGLNAGGVTTRVFNPMAILNKGLAGIAAVWALKELLPNKWSKLLYNVALPPLVGYTIGRVFDDPVDFEGSTNEVSARNIMLNANPHYPARGVTHNYGPIAQNGDWFSQNRSANGIMGTIALKSSLGR